MNTQAVLATLVSGLTHEEMMNYSLSMGVACLSSSAFYIKQAKLVEILANASHDTIEQELDRVLEEKLAEQPNPDARIMLELSWDFAWGTRGYNSKNGAGRMLYYCPKARKYMCLVSQTMSKTRTVCQEGKTIVVHQGNHDGSSKSMEHACLKMVLSYLQNKLEAKAVDGKRICLSLCVDGDVGCTNELLQHPSVVSVSRDLSHVLKNVHKHVTKALGTSTSTGERIISVRNWLATVLHQANTIKWSNEVARDQFLNYTQHHSGNHEKCLPTASCSRIDYVPGSMELKGRGACKRLLEVALKVIWPEGSRAAYVTTQRTSPVESINHECSRFHPKDTGFLTSWDIRDQIAVVQHNRGRVATLNLFRQSIGLPVLNDTVALSTARRQRKAEWTREYKLRKQKQTAIHIKARETQRRQERSKDKQLALVEHGNAGPIGNKRLSKKEREELWRQGDSRVQQCPVCSAILLTTSNLTHHRKSKGCQSKCRKSSK